MSSKIVFLLPSYNFTKKKSWSQTKYIIIIISEGLGTSSKEVLTSACLSLVSKGLKLGFSRKVRVLILPGTYVNTLVVKVHTHVLCIIWIGAFVRTTALSKEELWKLCFAVTKPYSKTGDCSRSSPILSYSFPRWGSFLHKCLK